MANSSNFEGDYILLQLGLVDGKPTLALKGTAAGLHDPVEISMEKDGSEYSFHASMGDHTEKAEAVPNGVKNLVGDGGGFVRKTDPFAGVKVIRDHLPISYFDYLLKHELKYGPAAKLKKGQRPLSKDLYQFLTRELLRAMGTPLYI